MWSGIKKRCLYFSLHHRWEISRRRPTSAKSNTTGPRRLFVEEEKKVRRDKWRAQLSKAKVLAVRFLAHVHATKTLGTTGCRSPGHENLPDFSLFLSPSLIPSTCRPWRVSRLPVLFSNVPIAEPHDAARSARKSAYVIFASSTFSSEIAPDVLSDA